MKSLGKEIDTLEMFVMLEFGVCFRKRVQKVRQWEKQGFGWVFSMEKKEVGCVKYRG